MHKNPVLGVSRCLLGDAVRYDGDSKPNTIVIEQLGGLFELVAVCPEVEAGLSIPRAPVQLTGSIEEPQMTGRDDPGLDVTEALHAYCTARPAELGLLSGFVFKSRSPSCGLDSTPVFIDGRCVTESGRGLFARAMTRGYPRLPVIEETGLAIREQREGFIEEVLRYSMHNSNRA